MFCGPVMSALEGYPPNFRLVVESHETITHRVPLSIIMMAQFQMHYLK
jgi:hypothetical protein